MQYWFLLVFLLVAVEAAIVGVDIGSEYIRVGIAESNAPIRMVLNEQSSAKTLNAIVVKGSNETYVGERAKKFISGSRYTLFRNLRYLIGVPASQDAHGPLKTLYTPVSYFKNTRGGFSTKMEGDQEVSVEELFASTLHNIKCISENDSTEQITNYILTIPHWLTSEQRRAISEAAKVARIEPIHFIPENVAMALKYAKSKHHVIVSSTKKYHLVLFDFGATKLTTTVFEYITFGEDEGTITVLSVVSDTKIGGAFMDVLVAEYLVPDEKIKKEPKTMMKMILETKKAKEALTVNPSINVQVALSDDKDFSVKLTREEFDRACSGMQERIKKVVKTAIEKAGNPHIDAIELVGGASRVPFVKRVLSNIFGNTKLSQTLNDEDSTVGAVFSHQAKYTYDKEIPQSKQVVFGVSKQLETVLPMSQVDFDRAYARFAEIAAYEQKQIDDTAAKNLRAEKHSPEFDIILDEVEEWLNDDEDRDWVMECKRQQNRLEKALEHPTTPEPATTAPEAVSEPVTTTPEFIPPTPEPVTIQESFENETSTPVRQVEPILEINVMNMFQIEGELYTTPVALLLALLVIQICHSVIIYLTYCRGNSNSRAKDDVTSKKDVKAGKKNKKE